MSVVTSKDIRGESVRGNPFTLVEMLVVIAVIALLLAMFLPVIAKAKEKAMEAVCKNNLRQIGSAVACYPDENNGYAIPCVFEVQIRGKNKCYSWIDYLHNNRAIGDGSAKCPSMDEGECFDPWGGG